MDKNILADAFRSVGIPFATKLHDSGDVDLILDKDGGILLGYGESTTVFMLDAKGYVKHVAMM